MKTRWIQLISVLAMVAICISVCTTTVNATVVWSDDFDDRDFDGWTTPNNSRVYDGDYGWNGSDWTADNQYLELDQEEWGIITHPSNVVYGTWSFDFRINETLSTYGVRIAIAFISNNITDLDDITEGIWYYIQFDAPTGVNLYASFGKSGAELATNNTPIPVSGWHHIDVTRNTTGWFEVYHNCSLIIQEVDTQIDTSEMFWLWFQRRQMIDNVVVDDEPIPLPDQTTPTTPTTTTPTTTTPPPPPLPVDLILIAGGAAVVVIVLAIVFLRRR